MQFDKDILARVYREELDYFRIRPNGTNRIKQLLDQVNDMTGEGQNPLTQEQLLSVIAQTNMFTTADIVAYCLQSYYDQRNEFDINESLYSSGIERTNAYFDDAPCLPPYSHEVPKVDYIENVLFKCFSSYMIKKGYRATDIYRYMIRFGCIFNPRSNIVVSLFNNLSTRYLRGAEEGNEYGFTDGNMFTGKGNVVNLSSRMYLQITTSSFYNDVISQPFMVTIDYGNIKKLNARPYAVILQALFYMRDNNVNDYEKIVVDLADDETMKRIMREEDERRQAKEEEDERVKQQQLRKQRRQQLRQEQVINKWFKSRSLFGNQGGGIERRIKSKKNKKVKVNKKTHYSRNKSRRHRQQRKSAEKR